MSRFRRTDYAVVAFFLAIFLHSADTAAHTFTPIQITIENVEAGKYSINQFSPLSAWPEPQHTMALDFGDGCDQSGGEQIRIEQGTETRSFELKCDQDTLEIQVRSESIDNNLIALIVKSADHDSRYFVLTSRSTALTLDFAEQYERSLDSGATSFRIFVDLARLGIRHVSVGFDHLAVIVCLVILLQFRLRPICMTVTLFTVAHSITLLIASFGLVRLPSPPVETLIAYSVFVLARDILEINMGQATLTVARVFPMIFFFGLLHGLGFAGGLAGVDLETEHAIATVLGFNTGVELFQLAFVSIVLAIFHMGFRLGVDRRLASICSGYMLGSVSVFWIYDRLATF